MPQLSFDGWEFFCLEADSKDFHEVLKLRRKLYNRPEAGDMDQTDLDSLHFVASFHGEMHGSVRITPSSKASSLPLEVQFPEWITNEFRPYIAASTRYCLSRSAGRWGGIGEQLIRMAWNRLLPLETYMIVAPVRADLLVYYFNMGAIFARDWVLNNDAWDIKCSLGILPADPDRVPQFGDVFKIYPPKLDFQRLYGSGLVVTTRNELLSLQNLLRNT